MIWCMIKSMKVKIAYIYKSLTVGGVLDVKGFVSNKA
jgi:primosomal replication protein N